MQTSFTKITEILKGYSLPPFNLVIKRFGTDFEEQLDSFTNESDLFPILWVTPPTSNTIGRNVNTYTFDIIVLDQIMEGRENITTIVSDCHLILIDFYKWVVESTTLDIDIIQEPNTYSVNNSQLDGLAGARMTVSIEVDSIGVCQIPIQENITPIPPDPICEDATALLKDSEGLLISSTTIGSGLVGNITAPNGTVTATNSEATTIGSTTVLSNGTANIPISDSTITLNSSAFLSVPAENSQNIILVDQNDAPIIPDSVIGNEIKVNVPTSGSLPSGTYTPKNFVSGPFDLLWEGQTANVVTSDGTIEKVSGAGSYDGSAIFLINHKGDFTLNYNIDDWGSSNDSFQLSGLNRNKLNNSYEQLENCVFSWRGQGIAVYEKGVLRTGYIGNSSSIKIQRIGSFIYYYSGATLMLTTQMAGAGGVFFDCSISSLTTISNIQVIIP